VSRAHSGFLRNAAPGTQRFLMNVYKGKNMQATNSIPASTLGFLDECHNMVLEHLRPHIKKLFESSDLAFLEFAEKAQSNASQLRFFEAMTVIQRNRKNIEGVFYRELGQSFADFGSAGIQAGPTSVIDNDALTLISKEDSDIQVAIQNMVANASLGSAQELIALRQRLAVLNHGKQMEEKNIPGGPTCLANAFHQGVSNLVLEHQTLLIVYMLFNKFVLSKTAPLYDEYNKHLLKAGLLPNLKYAVRINPEKARTQSKAADGNVTHAGREEGSSNNQTLGDELFGNIMQLLSRRDSQGQENAAGNRGHQAAAISNPIPQTELVSALHQLQQSRPINNPVVTGNTGTVGGIRENKQLVATLVANLSADRDRLFDGIDRRRLPTADTHVIDLVGMMFEYMLNDDRIPSVAKAELSRLHTPYLKVAIIDKGLFTNTNHPAHKLLNTLARAAARWVFENKLDRGIFPSIHNVVERTITEFESNIDIFSELLELFNANVHDLETKSTAIEKRTQQAAEGKEKLELARRHAAAAIEKCMQGHTVPVPVKKLLHGIWQEKLTFIYLREPEAAGSDSWQLAVQTIEAIIWSVEPRASIAEQTELRDRFPEVQKQIELSIETLSAYGSTNDKSQLALIRDIQEAILRKPVNEYRTPEHTSAPVPVAGLPSDAVHETAIDKEVCTTPADEPLSPEVAAAMSALGKIAFGTWFSIQEDEDALPENIKLSWYSQMSGNYMFVDSMGMKAQVRKQAELATLMVAGKAIIIQTEQSPLIRRALEAIRRMLGGEQRVPA
jgi:hypothetical protein